MPPWKGVPLAIPLIEFIRATRRRPDAPALAIVAAILVLSAGILAMPFIPAARTQAMRRSHLAGWPLPVWAIAQPVPSMYNFENHWEVTFEGTASAECRRHLRGYVNHQVFSAVLMRRAAIESCGLPADVRFWSTYRGTTLETHYRAVRQPAAQHGLVVTLLPHP